YVRCVLRQDIPFDSPVCIDTTFFPPGHWTGFYTTDTYCIIPELKCAPPPPPAPYNVEATSDTQAVYLTWENAEAYDVLYLYREPDTLVFEVLPGDVTSYSDTPDTPGLYCYYLEGEKSGAVSGYSDPACAPFCNTAGCFLGQPSVIPWADSLHKFYVLNCYTPGGYTPGSYLPSSYTPDSYEPGGYPPPIPGECDSGFFWDPDDSLCRQECAPGYFWDADDNLCRENCQEGYFWDGNDNLCRENCDPGYFWDDYSNLCWEECDPGFFWDSDDSLCRQNCVIGYEWINSLNQCCESGKSSEYLGKMGTGWSFGNPAFPPDHDYLGWGTNLQDEYYEDNICTPALIGAILKVPDPQPAGGTRVYLKHWFRTADENDRLVVSAREHGGTTDEILFPIEDGSRFWVYAPGTGDNLCGNDIPGFAHAPACGPDDFCWSRFNIPTSFDGKRIRLKFILGSDASGHQGPGGTNTGWFINKMIFIGTDLHRGDCNCDGAITSADIVYLINYLYINGPKPCELGDHGSAGDANCDGSINSADVVFLINYLFVNGPAPPCPP
ncbi:MAG: dockerin type I repeat-containing protein, partial [Candidatus Zixiibacteriota bacterium]